MRIITLDSRVLHPDTLAKIKAVPYFGDDEWENGRGFKSNMYNFENKIYITDDLCYPKDRRDTVLTMKAKQTSNLIAIFDQLSGMYWVIKNRYLGREGWHTRDEFQVLVMKEVDPVKFWNSPQEDLI